MTRYPQQLPRRRFLQATAAALGTATISPNLSYAASPNGKLRTAHVGVGGMGGADLRSIRSHSMVEVAGLCDVDSGRLASAAKGNPAAETFADYREMVDKLGDSIDAVVVSTPDHTHAPAAMFAMQAGKAVYCQKPLTHTVHEARRLREVAAEKNLVTQMGAQIHSAAAYRRAVKMIQSGVIGKVSEVHAWSGKNWGYDKPELPPSSPPPNNLSWDLWLGVAEDREYAGGVYHPGNWRRMIDFGTGTLGDMGAHIIDTPFTALELSSPSWVVTTCRPPTGIGHPEKNKVEMEFPGTKHTTETLSWKWYDGRGNLPTEFNDVLQGQRLPGQGSMLVGERGHLLVPHVSEPRLFGDFADYKAPNVENGNHYHQWVDACLGKGETSLPFGLAGPMTEALLLGVVANRFPGQKLEWDPEALKFTNVPEANALLKTDYRAEFAVEGLA